MRAKLHTRADLCPDAASHSAAGVRQVSDDRESHRGSLPPSPSPLGRRPSATQVKFTPSKEAILSPSSALVSMAGGTLEIEGCQHALPLLPALVLVLND